MKIFHNSFLIMTIITSSLAFSSMVMAGEPLSPQNELTAAQHLLQLLKPFKSLEADFMQESYDSNDHQLQKQNGSFKVTEKGEFIWDILKPYEQRIISDGKTIKIFDPDLEQLTIKPVDKKNQIIPLLLFSGKSEDITRQYKVTQAAQETFDLSAQNANSLFEKLQIVFKNGNPDSLMIIDTLKQKTVVTFKKVIANPSLKASAFQFEPAAGIDVIDER